MISIKQDIVKSLLYLATSDITKVPGFYFYKTDKLEIEFLKETDKWCVDGEELDEKTKKYTIEMINDFKILLPKKNLDTLFIDGTENKEKEKKNNIVNRVKSIIKK